LNPTVLRLIYQPAVSRAAHSALVGRNWDRAQAGKGRVTRSDVRKILRQVWKRYGQLATRVPLQATVGNQMNILLACITFCCLETLLELGVGRSYAIELIGDVSWGIYEKWAAVPLTLARFRPRDARGQMRFAVNAFLRFPFSPPGYLLERLTSQDGISFDVRRCMIAEYFRDQGAADLCVGTWCNLDFALAEMWGGWLERSQTLAAGSSRCDFRFKALGLTADTNLQGSDA